MMRNMLLALTLFGFCACATIKSGEYQQSQPALIPETYMAGYEMQHRGVDFYASGTGSEWFLEIDFDKKVRFVSSKISHDFEVDLATLGEGLIGSEATHQVISKDGELSVRIKRKKDPFTPQQEKPFEVEVNYKSSKSNEPYLFTGEGEFYGAIRLHDIWMLEEINGEKIDDAPLGDRPSMEVHLNAKRAMGFLGCNTYTCMVYFGRGQICFSPLLSTKKACLNSDVEQRFSKALGNQSFTYRFEGLNLILENKTDTLLFKKTD